VDRPGDGRARLPSRRNDRRGREEPGIPDEHEDGANRSRGAYARRKPGGADDCGCGEQLGGAKRMFITKKALPRRTFLRGAGATIALPFLDAMVPALRSSAYASEIAPTRFTGIFIPHGAAPGYWVPESSERGFEFPYIWKPLEPFRDRVVLTSGLWSQSSEPP